MTKDKKNYIIDSFTNEFNNNIDCRNICSDLMDIYIKNIEKQPETQINKVYDSIANKTKQLQSRNKKK